MAVIRARSKRLLVRAEIAEECGFTDELILYLGLDEHRVLRDVAKALAEPPAPERDGRAPVTLRTLGYAVTGAIERGDLEAAEAAALAVVDEIRDMRRRAT